MTDEQKMLKAWINFAKNGIPSAEGLPEWADAKNGAVMIPRNRP